MVSEPCQITWFSYINTRRQSFNVVSEPCQITWFSYRMRAPALRRNNFRAVPNHLVLLRCAGLSRLLVRFRTVLNHLDFFTALKASKSFPLSKPCQIIWFFYLKTNSPPVSFCFTAVSNRRARLPPWRGGIATSREPTGSARGLSDVLICYLLAHSTSLAPKADTGLYPGKVPP